MEAPITERSNALSTSIDIALPQDIVKIIGQCEKQIYTGWEHFEGLQCKKFLRMMELISAKICSMLQHPHGKAIVFSGCGTSGRIGFMAVRSANAMLKELNIEPIFHYLVSGNDRGLFLSVESAEDSPATGIQMLQEVTEGKAEVLFIGITCGFSAPFIAGQLDYCLQHPNFTPVLVGFNPCHLARNDQVENWDKTFKQVVQAMTKAEEVQRAFILNPVIGPEPISGSSRMKGGTATKIMLDMIIDMALELHSGKIIHAKERLMDYEKAHEVFFNSSENIGDILKVAGTSLCSGGHIYYLGADGLGILGLIDASECPPTFGADPDSVRGFLQGGYEHLGNKEGDLSSQIEISAEKFLQKNWPTLSSKDTVIFLCQDGKLPDLPKDGTAAHTVLVSAVNEPELIYHQINHYDTVLQLQLPTTDEPTSPPSRIHIAEIMTKWLCNCVSTGAHIMLGKIYENFMIDVGVRNKKLYHRATNIIKKFVNVSQEEAETLLLKSIYQQDILTSCQLGAPVSSHITVASSKSKVVPRAILLGKTKSSIGSVQDILAKSPRIRTALMELLRTS